MGIIETVGEVIRTKESDGNRIFRIKSPFVDGLVLGQSVAHNGVCLTVSILEKGYYEVVAIEETLNKTNLVDWKIGEKINLERCMKIGDRLDGHLVQGHIDTVGKVKEIVKNEGSWLVSIDFDSKYARLIVEKGSICVDGVSLTIVEAADWFSIGLIPFTLEHTHFNNLQVGQRVNLEFDIVGKYILRMASLTKD